jgi:hypothetical protein
MPATLFISSIKRSEGKERQQKTATFFLKQATEIVRHDAVK